ncbi:MASE1 domain-containing protein [Archangium primigenium]|uniref:MASE1 domain-containing protein n=1 Tax=[Archangium] primigenium TaxID=2792470 RepID=UPI001959E301|nr:MASE1 domain-containing protein [Archangium primigenium]
MPESKHILQRWPPLQAGGLFLLLYGVSAWLGMRLTPPGEHFSAIWPPSGVLLTALLLARGRHWPALLAAALVLEPLASAPGHWPTPGTLLLSADNALEALVGAFLLRRSVGLRPSLRRMRDVLGLLGLTVLLCPIISATPGATILALYGKVAWVDWWRQWRVFWVGDAMGVLLVAPLLLSWGAEDTVRWPRRRVVELGVLLLALVLTVNGAFQWAPATPSPHHPLPYAAFPFILWAALRFEARGTTLALLALAAVSVAHTLQGHGPFALAASDTLEATSAAATTASLLFLQSFLAAVGGSGLLLAAAVSEQGRAREKSERLNAELSQSLRELAATQRELVRRERMAAVGELSASVAHEVRNPLAVIANSVAALIRLSRPEANSTAWELLGVMGEEVERLDLLVNGLLDFARPLSPRLLFQPLGPVVEGALDSALRSENRPGPFLVTRALDPEVPEAPLDAQLLHRALNNLFLNALQAMPQGGTLQVGLGHAESPEGPPQAVITITDTGTGISPEVMRRLFEPFFTTKALGTGLGLAIVRGIIEAHHGQVAVKSTPGEGTTFTIRLPLTAEVPRELPRESPRDAPRA